MIEIKLVSNFDKDGGLIFNAGFPDINADKIMIVITRKGMDDYRSGGIIGIDIAEG